MKSVMKTGVEQDKKRVWVGRENGARRVWFIPLVQVPGTLKRGAPWQLLGNEFEPQFLLGLYGGCTRVGLGLQGQGESWAGPW